MNLVKKLVMATPLLTVSKCAFGRMSANVQIEALMSLLRSCSAAEWRERKGLDPCLVVTFNKSEDYFRWSDMYAHDSCCFSFCYTRTIDGQVVVQISLRSFFNELVRSFAKPWLVNIRRR